MTSGPIKNLDMDDDNMTMVFHVQEPAMLKPVKPGDKVQFEAEKVSAGLHHHQVPKGEIVGEKNGDLLNLNP